MPGKIVSKNELAAVFGKTPKTLTIWQNEGMPYVKAANPGEENQYDTAACIQWLIRRETTDGLDLDEERAKQAREQTETARLKNEAMRGEMIPLTDAIDGAQRSAFAIRQKIVTSSMSDEEKRNLLIDIHALADTDFRNFKRLDESDEDGQRQEPAK